MCAMPATMPVSAPRASTKGSSKGSSGTASRTPRRRGPSNNTIDVKLSVVRRAASGENIRSLARELKVSVKTVKRWCQASESLEKFIEDRADAIKMPSNLKRPTNGVDRALHQWFVEERRLGHQVKGTDIRRQAMKLNAELGGPESFKASQGFLMRFLQRHGLQSQSVAKDQPPAEPADPATEEELVLRAFLEEQGNDPRDFDNADESGRSGKHANFTYVLPSEKPPPEPKPPKEPEPIKWCLDCCSAATPRCVDEHDVRTTEAALRLSLQDAVPRASQALQWLQDGLQGLQDGAALTALRLLRGPPATSRLTLRQDDGEAFAAEWWRIDGQAAEDSLLQTLIVALAASGRLMKEPNAEEDAPPALQRPAEECIEEIDLKDMSLLCGSDEQREKTAETVRRVRQRGVRRLTNVWCDHLPDGGTLDVLRSAAPALEELQVFNASEAHLAAAHGMPRLQRLELYRYLDQGPVELPALSRPSRLKWLRVWGLPRDTTVSLLRAHAASLDVLWLRVDSELDSDWPRGCGDLDALLRQCGLRLSRLVLWRFGCPHPRTPCRAQLEAARRVLPDCTVQCDECHHVRNGPF